MLRGSICSSVPRNRRTKTIDRTKKIYISSYIKNNPNNNENVPNSSRDFSVDRYRCKSRFLWPVRIDTHSCIYFVHHVDICVPYSCSRIGQAIYATNFNYSSRHFNFGHLFDLQIQIEDNI